MKNIVWHHIRTGIISIMMIVSFYSYASPPTYNNISIYNNNGKALIYNRAGYPEYVTFLPESQIDSAFFYANTSLVPVIFKVNKYDLQNAQPIDSIITTINKIMSEPEVHLAYIWIGGSASPEGPPTWNKKLGHYRSQALAQYLRSTTELPDSIFRIENLEEDWYSFTVALRTKDTFPHRNEILHIIASEPDTEKRKLQIKAIDGGRTWSRVIHEFFPPFRNARMVIVCYDTPQQLTATQPRIAVPYYPATQLASAPQAFTATAPRKWVFAIKNNLLFTAILTANLGFEVQLWDHFSLDVPVWYSPYDLFTPRRKIRLLATQPEVRWWMGDVMKGHFIGLHTHIVGFNIALNDYARYQDPNHALWGMGLSYGYALPLDKTGHWGIEFNIGFGFAEYSYDAYRNWDNGPRFSSGQAWYWGLTRAGVTLSYKWAKPLKNKKKR